MRILHIVPSLEIGGLEHIVLDFTLMAVNAGHQVDVLCLDRPGDLAASVERGGGRVFCLYKPPGFRFTELDGLRDTLRKISPDVIHTHYPGALFYAGPLARRMGLNAIIHTVHGAHYEGGWRHRMTGRLGARHAKHIVCVSKATANHVLQHHITRKKKIQVIYNGINISHFQSAHSEGGRIRAELGIPQSTYVIGTVGRLSDVKRQDTLLRAFVNVHQSIPKSHLLVVGDGPNRQQLVELTKSLGLEEHVIFAGYRADRECCLAAMDTFALTSDSEGTPLSLLEAWATGLPAVVTAVGGLPELIENGTTGILVPPGNHEMFGAELKRILKNHKLRSDLAKASSNLVQKRFSREEMLAQYMILYKSVIKSPLKKT